jgi:hypothetical protein
MELDDGLVDLIGAAVGSLTEGTNLFPGPEREVSDEIPGLCCFVLMTGGPMPVTHNAGGSGTDTTYPAAMITIRSDDSDFKGGQTLGLSVQAAIQKKSPSTHLTYSCEVQQSKPNYLGQDERGYHRWTINVIALKEE